MASIQRFFKIYSIISKHRLDQAIDLSKLPWYARYLLLLGPHRFYAIPNMPLEARARFALEDLGPIFVKFGQALSTRRDLLPLNVADELAKLQDKVTPFDGDIAQNIIETELGQSTSEVFTAFNKTPLASASIAQVHEATLPNGKEVIVKVVRPGIQGLITQDISLLYSIANFAQKYISDSRRLKPVELVKEYEITILDELDMQREAANTSQLRRNFLNSNLLYVPEIYFDYTRTSLLVMEKIHGIPISDNAAMKQAGINMKALAERGVEIFFTQVFRDNFFHADMHPGNIFVSYENPETPQYIGIDCAIIGSLTDFDRYYLACNLLSIFRQDYAEVAKLHIESGWVPAHTRAADFEGAIRSACEPIFEKPISEIGFAQILLYLFKVARRFEMEVQPSLVLLQKTLLNIEGLGRELYPQLNLWDTAMPFLETWMNERYSPSSMLKQMRKKAPYWLEQLPQIPDLLLHNLQYLAHKRLENTDNTQQALLKEAETRYKQRRNKWLGCGILILGVAASQTELLVDLMNQPLFNVGLIVTGLVILLRS